MAGVMETLLPFIPSFIAYILGIVTGLLVRSLIDVFNNKKDDNENFARAMILVVVLMVWLASTVIDFVDATYETPLAIHAIMGSVVGFFFKPIDLGELLKWKKPKEK